MEWKEKLFKKVYEYIKHTNVQNYSKSQLNQRVFLKDNIDRFTYLARILTGSPIEILKSENEGGYAQNTFFLPEYYDKFDNIKSNLNFYIFRVFYLSVQKKNKFNWFEKESLDLESSRKIATINSEVILKIMFKEFPGVETIFNELLQLEDRNYMLFGKVFKDNKNNEVLIKTHESKKNVDLSTEPEITTELETSASELVDVLTANNKSIEDYTLMHSFEKVETAEEFSGSWRELDGSDELNEHKDSLKEVKMKHVVRSDNPTHSIYKSEHLRNTYIPLSGDIKSDKFHIPYDEWDYNKQQYRKSFCKVFPNEAIQSSSEYVEETINEQYTTIRELSKKFSQFYNEKEKVKFQVNGEDMDLDKVIQNITEIKIGNSPSEKIYFTKRKRHKDISILLLMDLSLSTDSFSKGERVLDVEKKSVISFCEVLSNFDARFQVDGFSSRTRNNCDYINIKSFKENWNTSKTKIGPLSSGGYTRIGPAIRHATAIIKKEKSKKKWIILLSDGKPNDFDRYEGKYGIEDVRQAKREALRSNVHIFALAIEDAAKHYLPRMFGQSEFKILNSPNKLPLALSEFYSRINK